MSIFSNDQMPKTTAAIIAQARSMMGVPQDIDILSDEERKQARLARKVHLVLSIDLPAYAHIKLAKANMRLAEISRGGP